VNRRPFEVGDAASNPGRAEERPTGHTLARIDALTTGEVIHRVEETLRQMQHGIDRLKHDQGQRTDAFKFPGRAGTDRDDLPPAA
jgi:hypothetical protein